MAPLSQVLVRTHEAMLKKTGALMSREEWEAIVGARIASRTRVGRVQGGCLLINAASSAWAAELSFLSRDILARLAERGHDIERLKVRVEAFPAPAVAPRPGGAMATPAPSQSPAELPADLLERLRKIDDPHLRAAIAEAATQSLNPAGRPPPRGR